MTRRRQYFLVILLGFILAVVSLVIESNCLAFAAGMFFGGGSVAFDREAKCLTLQVKNYLFKKDFLQ